MESDTNMRDIIYFFWVKGEKGGIYKDVYGVERRNGSIRKLHSFQPQLEIPDEE